MPRARKTEFKINSSAWMTTYTDLMMLLLTFFVMLISLSVIKPERRMAALDSVSGAFGARKEITGGASMLGDPGNATATAGPAPVVRAEADLERLTGIELKNALETEMTLTREEERIIITLSDRVLFKPGSNDIDESRIEFLSDLREILKESPSRIELRGYAASSETVLDPEPGWAAMTLSAKRAFSLFHFLSDQGEIQPERIVAHGFGSNAETRGTAKDSHEMSRQVQIILDYREKVPHRLKKPKRDSFLDFKGFLFRIPGGEGGS